MAAHYGGIVEYIWKRVSRFDYNATVVMSKPRILIDGKEQKL